MMKIVSLILVGLVALEHLYILYVEMFAWETIGKKLFGGSLSSDMFAKTKTLAANQGLYNGFLSAGLLWSFWVDDAEWAYQLRVFFLLCVVVAAVYGALTASRAIIVNQGLLAILALLFTFLSRI